MFNEEDDAQFDWGFDDPELGVREPIKPKSDPGTDGIALELPEKELALV